MTDHDRLFKELLTTFFIEFLELFLPEVAAFVEPDSLVALDKELFSDIALGERYETDILMQSRFKGQEAWFLIHLETQSYREAEFEERMFRYFIQLYLKYKRPIYPIALFSYDYPLRKEPNNFRLDFPHKSVLEFRYDVIQLNRFNWRDYLNRPNPVASALMAKMRIKPKDRPKVKLECLRMLVGLKLNPAKEQLISGFVDTYLNLNEIEKLEYRAELEQILPVEKESVMQIETSWKREGRVEGRTEGRIEGQMEGQLKTILVQLNYRFGKLTPQLEESIKVLPADQLENLSLALLNFQNSTDLEKWLEKSA